MQRLRIKFSRGGEIKFISHLDIIRLWQRVMARAAIPLAYSEGFNPHPRISLASPLALGVTSQAELMDIFCTKWVSPHWFTSAVSRQLTPGLGLLQVNTIPVIYPSLQSQTRFSEYLVMVDSPFDAEALKYRISSLLAMEQLPWQHQRDTGTRSYDLRRLIDDIWLTVYQAPEATIGMRLRCDNLGSGRPEQVCLALGLGEYPLAINRTRLILAIK
ncbi:MAG: TIGR03936 family radical SAM-associated protein [Dehalococcoidales bacterium]|jgi:radical SAM-linked protein